MPGRSAFELYGSHTGRRVVIFRIRLYVAPGARHWCFMNISQYDRCMNLVKWVLGDEHIVHIETIQDSNVNVAARLE